MDDGHGGRDRVLPLPRAFKAWRDLRGWSQKELAVRASEVGRRSTGDITARVSGSAIGMIEAGDRDPSPEFLSWIAEALGVDEGVLAIRAPELYDPCPTCRAKAFVPRVA